MQHTNNTLSKQKIVKALKKNLRALYNIMPILISVMLIISLINSALPQDIYKKILIENDFANAFSLDVIGSVLAGNPITAYVISENLIQNGVSLFVITTFILAWTTVGVVQYPAEAHIMGKKFAIIRNVAAFLFAVIISFISVSIYQIFI